MAVRLVTDFDEFTSLRETWNELAGAASFRRWEWMHSWFETYRESTRLHILKVTDEGGRVIGFAPWHCHESWRYGKCLRFLGDGKACGDDLSLIAAAGSEDRVVDEVVDWLTGSTTASTWDWIRLEGASAADPLVRRLEQQLAERGATALRRDDLSRWFVPIPADWDAFVAQFGRNGRHHARASRRKAEASENGFRLVAPQNEEECLAQFAAIRDMHQRRWEGQDSGGCFSYPGFESFLRTAVLRWFAERSLYMRILERHGRPLVGGIGVCHGDVISLYLFGREPGADESDIGKLLNYQTIREAIEGGYKKVDFLRGDEQYKGRLGAVAAPQVLVQIANRGALNRVRYYATTGREAAKKLVGKWERRSWRRRRSIDGRTTGVVEICWAFDPRL